MYLRKSITFAVMKVWIEQIGGERDLHARQDITWRVIYQFWNEKDINLKLCLIIITLKPQLEVTHNSKYYMALHCNGQGEIDVS